MFLKKGVIRWEIVNSCLWSIKKKVLLVESKLEKSDTGTPGLVPVSVATHPQHLFLASAPRNLTKKFKT